MIVEEKTPEISSGVYFWIRAIIAAVALLPPLSACCWQIGSQEPLSPELAAWRLEVREPNLPAAPLQVIGKRVHLSLPAGAVAILSYGKNRDQQKSSSVSNQSQK